MTSACAHLRAPTPAHQPAHSRSTATARPNCSTNGSQTPSGNATVRVQPRRAGPDMTRTGHHAGRAEEESTSALPSLARGAGPRRSGDWLPPLRVATVLSGRGPALYRVGPSCRVPTSVERNRCRVCRTVSWSRVNGTHRVDLEAVSRTPKHRLRAGLHADLPVRGPDEDLDRVDAPKRTIRNFLVAQPVINQIQDLGLARRQPRRPPGPVTYTTDAGLIVPDG